MKTKEEYFQAIVDLANSIGLQLSEYRLLEDPNIDSPLFIDYPAQWYYYCVAGMSVKEALLTEYPSLLKVIS
ncbi:TPA: hypothetical protein QDZ66_000640 [Pluralibacter gergoviae]|uniref:hypothetical protein n=1 Tax=Pluralibacter gergoviae TaxID=61647 RepID=UPI00065027CC|nr:hypothetical protein [Pluralibacter gergoviae]KMK20927.1 hypothetical protein ABW10_22205 [Pluralibacter gergoviae]MBL3694262.1 hypothetical protein [Pluralibacter gergoviae]HDS1149925.1 hypothetical protein [Pluralibacter gergoviae]